MIMASANYSSADSRGHQQPSRGPAEATRAQAQVRALEVTADPELAERTDARIREYAAAFARNRAQRQREALDRVSELVDECRAAGRAGEAGRSRSHGRPAPLPKLGFGLQ